MKNREISPIPVIVIAVLAVVALGYFFLVRPGAQEDKIKKEWISPEAAALRGPGRPKDSAHDQFLAGLRQKTGRTDQPAQHRRRDTE